MRTTYQHTKFECLKCKQETEILYELGTEPPSCKVCGGKTIEVVSINDFSEGRTVAFKGLSTPGSSMPVKSTMSKPLLDKWHQRRIEQFKKTGK